MKTYGIKSRTSSFNVARMNHFRKCPTEEHIRLSMHCGDLTGAANLVCIILDIPPDVGCIKSEHVPNDESINLTGEVNGKI